MKNILTLSLLISIAIPVFCQTMPVDKATGLYTYTGVVKADSSSAKDIYYALQLWALNAYDTGNIVAQVGNAEKSIIVFKPSLELYEHNISIGHVFYTLTVECKDGKYKYTFTNFTRQYGNCDSGPFENETYRCGTPAKKEIEKIWAYTRQQTNNNIAALIADMKQSVAKTLHGKKSDW